MLEDEGLQTFSGDEEDEVLQDSTIHETESQNPSLPTGNFYSKTIQTIYLRKGSWADDTRYTHKPVWVSYDLDCWSEIYNGLSYGRNPSID